MEFAVEDTVKNKAIAAGWFVRKVKWIGRKSAPDHVFAKDGRIAWIEFKAQDGGPSVLQAREIKRMQKAGLEVYSVDSVAEGLKILGLWA